MHRLKHLATNGARARQALQSSTKYTMLKTSAKVGVGIAAFSHLGLSLMDEQVAEIIETIMKNLACRAIDKAIELSGAKKIGNAIEDKYHKTQYQLATALAVLDGTASAKYKDKEKLEKEIPLHYDEIKKLRKQWDDENQAGFQTKSEAADKLLARAKQILDLYKDTHYVFIHATQSTHYAAQKALNKLAIKQGLPKPRFFAYIRNPDNGMSPQHMNKCLDEVRVGKLRNDGNPDARKLLISCDSNFRRTAPYESSQYFLRKDGSILSDSRKVTERILADNSIPGTLATDQLTQLGKSIHADCGNLFVFCIPKDLLKNSDELQNVVYPAHGYGKRCNCNNKSKKTSKKESDLALLEYTQTQSAPNVMKCRNYRNYGNPQFRLITTELTPNNKVLSMVLTPLPKATRAQIKSEVSDTMDTYFHEKEKEKEKETHTTLRYFS